MDIGPIIGIRPVTRIKTVSPSADLPGVFAIELRKQARDDTTASQRADRGLEDEESENASFIPEDEDTSNVSALDMPSSSKVSFFA